MPRTKGLADERENVYVPGDVPEMSPSCLPRARSAGCAAAAGSASTNAANQSMAKANADNHHEWKGRGVGTAKLVNATTKVPGHASIPTVVNSGACNFRFHRIYAVFVYAISHLLARNSVFFL